MTVVRSVRETITVGLVALFMGMAVYTLLGLAWTYKTAYETVHKMWHPLGGAR